MKRKVGSTSLSLSGFLTVLILTVLNCGHGILVREITPLEPTMPLLVREPIRTSRTPFSPWTLVEEETKWNFNNRGQEKQPQRSLLSQMLSHPLLHRPFPILKLQNPFVEKEKKEVPEVMPPPPVRIRCCVRYTVPETSDTRARPHYSTSSTLRQNDMGSSWRSVPWRQNPVFLGQLQENLELPYDIPFPEFKYSRNAADFGGSENIYTLVSPFWNNDLEINHPNQLTHFQKYRTSTKEKKRKKCEREKNKSNSENVKVENTTVDPLDEVPEPYRSWILAGKQNSSSENKP